MRAKIKMRGKKSIEILLFTLNTIPNLHIRGKPYHLRKCGETITEVLGITLYLPLKVDRLILPDLGYNDGKETHCNLEFSPGVLLINDPHQPYLSL